MSFPHPPNGLKIAHPKAVKLRDDRKTPCSQVPMSLTQEVATRMLAAMQEQSACMRGGVEG